MEGTFTTRIDLGNEAMQTLEDLAAALRGIADRLDAGTYAGNIRDLNGNTVGDFALLDFRRLGRSARTRGWMV